MADDRVPTLVMPVGSRENVASKAIRIILERRLRILLVKGDRIYAECRGTDAMYHLGLDRGDWWCHCPNTTRNCSHIRALQYVTMRPE